MRTIKIQFKSSDKCEASGGSWTFNSPVKLLLESVSLVGVVSVEAFQVTTLVNCGLNTEVQ